MKAEILVGPERRRRWSAEEKARIVAETGAPGAQVAETLRFTDQPTILYDVLTHGCHVLKLLDQDGNVVALTTLMHDELETAAKDGGIVTRFSGLARMVLEHKGLAVAPE